jgi:excisionase family DNA binding protein
MSQPIRLSVSEAARIFGVASKTIRRAIADGTILYVVVRGRYKISFESLVRWSQERPKIKNKLDKTGIGQYVSQWKIRNKLYSPNPNGITSSSPRTGTDPHSSLTPSSHSTSQSDNNIDQTS